LPHSLDRFPAFSGPYEGSFKILMTSLKILRSHCPPCRTRKPTFGGSYSIPSHFIIFLSGAYIPPGPPWHRLERGAAFYPSLSLMCCPVFFVFSSWDLSLSIGSTALFPFLANFSSILEECYFSSDLAIASDLWKIFVSSGLLALLGIDAKSTFLFQFLPLTCFFLGARAFRSTKSAAPKQGPPPQTSVHETTPFFFCFTEAIGSPSL